MILALTITGPKRDLFKILSGNQLYFAFHLLNKTSAVKTGPKATRIPRSPSLTDEKGDEIHQ